MNAILLTVAAVLVVVAALIAWGACAVDAAERRLRFWDGEV